MQEIGLQLSQHLLECKRSCSIVIFFSRLQGRRLGCSRQHTRHSTVQARPCAISRSRPGTTLYLSGRFRSAVGC